MVLVVRTLTRWWVTNRPFAGLTDQLLDADNELIGHSCNVAYLAIVLGLELESYLIEERPNVPGHRARNLVNLGLGGMLHDIGKVRVDSEAAGHHENFEPDRPRPRQYENHLKFGYDMLHHAGAPPTVRHVVMAHHQRFDGRGWSDTVHMGAEGHHGRPAASCTSSHESFRRPTCSTVSCAMPTGRNARP